MKHVEFECTNCGNVVHRSILGNRDSVISMLRVIHREVDCCRDPDYIDNQGVLKHIRTSSVAQMY